MYFRLFYSPDQEKPQTLLRQVRIEAGLTQEELAAKLQKPQSFVSKFKSGERRLDLPELNQICRAVGVDLVGFVRRFVRH